ncbi:DUF4870 domain-containing protein [Rothia sp. AR01]|uniref:DUF4870 domain-containing protein n=1 Tax=Rothia santali TaxID=2949643 RepID=A0A9X2HKJ9_9MICC|nr:DUF4870 domain-containing protein [Rothia santali]MCP3426633.1 DUF4870 domain-containing protein [Rothia santali]
MTADPRTMDAYGNRIPPDARTMAMLSHLSSLASLLISIGSLSFLGPLIFWLIYKDKPGYAFVRACSAQAFNFNFTMWIVNVAAGLLAIVTFGLGFIVAGPIWAITGIMIIVFHIVGAVKANNGEVYRYPLQTKILT